ncbi:MAG: glutaredoxin domain-containing protein [Candidatus Thiodiazotropha sp.]
MNRIEIYTRPSCPYCSHAKALLQARNLSYEEIDASERKELESMLQRTNGRTFPQIVINDRPVGGYSELKQLDESGQLQILVAKR